MQVDSRSAFGLNQYLFTPVMALSIPPCLQCWSITGNHPAPHDHRRWRVVPDAVVEI